MAGYISDQSRDNIRRQRDILRLCTLFRGRMNEVVAGELIEDIGSLEEAARFLMLGDEDEIRRRLHESDEYVRSLQADAENFTRVLSRSKIDCQFACGDCNKMWWKRVPENKPVSKCMRCRRKYDPISEENQWGNGNFKCSQCEKTFSGFGIMSRTLSGCYSCGGVSVMTNVYPPKKREVDDKPRKHTHNCNGVNCYRSSTFHRLVGAQYIPGKPPVCIHPHSREPVQVRSTRIHCASRRHISTASTVDTFLDQGSLQTRSASPALSLMTIQEEY